MEPIGSRAIPQLELVVGMKSYAFVVGILIFAAGFIFLASTMATQDCSTGMRVGRCEFVQNLDRSFGGFLFPGIGISLLSLGLYFLFDFIKSPVLLALNGDGIYMGSRKRIFVRWHQVKSWHVRTHGLNVELSTQLERSFLKGILPPYQKLFCHFMVAMVCLDDEWQEVKAEKAVGEWLEKYVPVPGEQALS